MDSNETKETQALELVKVEAADYGLQATEAATVEAVFLPMIKAMTDLETEFNTITSAATITPETTKAATALRMRYVKIRTGTAEIHKKAKAYYLAGGRFIDGWKNAQAFASQGKEKALQEIEMHFINLEAARIEKLTQDRSEILKPYTDAIIPELGYMPDEVFVNYLEGTKIAHAAKLKRIQDEQAEADRIQKEEADRREALRIENETLKKEREEQNRIQEAERQEAQKKQQAVEDKARSERLQAEAEKRELQAKIDKDAEEARQQAAAKQQAVDDAARSERLKAEAKQREMQAQIDKQNKAIQDEKARVEKEKADRIQEEKRIQDERIAEAKKAAAAPEKQKLTAWIQGMEVAAPNVSSEAAQVIAADIQAKFAGFQRWALQQINTL